MSVEEDVELKTLVAQTLENKGILPKIRAELRANVFLALEENPNTKDTLLKNDELSAFLKVPFGTLALNLIREFLKFFELEFTLSVFDPETKFGKEYDCITRDKMLHELNLLNSNRKNPLLFEVINRLVNINKLGSANNEISQGNPKRNDISGCGDHGIVSPVPFNETFLKNPEVDSIPVSPKESENQNDTNESIKEDFSNNYSEGDSSSSAQLDFDKVVNIEPGLLPASNGCSEESKFKVGNAVPKDTIEIDLLTFTPVKETNPKEKLKNTQTPFSNNNEVTNDEKIEKHKSLPTLGDLPPLSKNSEEKDFDMNDVKAIIDEWSEKTSLNNKDNLSQKSGNTDTDEFKDDISDLLNGINSQDSSITIDETISKASCAADYLESI